MVAPSIPEVVVRRIPEEQPIAAVLVEATTIPAATVAAVRVEATTTQAVTVVAVLVAEAMGVAVLR